MYVVGQPWKGWTFLSKNAIWLNYLLNKATIKEHLRLFLLGSYAIFILVSNVYVDINPCVPHSSLLTRLSYNITTIAVFYARK